jgi:hypothetical protein
MEKTLASWLCNLAMACGSGNGPVQVNPAVTVYQINSHPALTQMSIDQIRQIGLDCNQRDYTISVLENITGNRPVNPEQLTADARQLNAVARSKIWQLRTYCP